MRRVSSTRNALESPLSSFLFITGFHPESRPKTYGCAVLGRLTYHGTSRSIPCKRVRSLNADAWTKCNGVNFVGRVSQKLGIKMLWIIDFLRTCDAFANWKAIWPRFVPMARYWHVLFVFVRSMVQLQAFLIGSHIFSFSRPDHAHIIAVVRSSFNQRT